MKLFIYVLISSFFLSCTDSDKKYSSEYLQFLKYKIEKVKNVPKIKLKITKTLQKGDRIILYGGENHFLKKYFDCDSCEVIISDFIFTKPTGDLAYIKFKNKKFQEIEFCIKKYYWDSKKGYDPLFLYVQERKYTSEEIKKLVQLDMVDVESILLDYNIGFKYK